jgi:hypothetical protein
MNGRFASPICTFEAFIKHWEKLRYPLDEIDTKCKTNFKPTMSTNEIPALFLY